MSTSAVEAQLAGAVKSASGHLFTRMNLLIKDGLVKVGALGALSLSPCLSRG